MYVLENPVLQRELTVNLRMGRAFVLLFLYQALLGAVVYFAWPQDSRLDLKAMLATGFPYSLAHASLLGEQLAALCQPIAPRKGLSDDVSGL